MTSEQKSMYVGPVSQYACRSLLFAFLLGFAFLPGPGGFVQAADSSAIAATQRLFQSLSTLPLAGDATQLAPSRIAHHDLSLIIGSGRLTPLKLDLPPIADVDSIIAVWLEAPVGIQISPQLPMEKERLRHLIGAPELHRTPTACLLIADARFGEELRLGSAALPAPLSGRSTTNTLDALRRRLATMQRSESYLMEEAVRAVLHPTSGRFLLLMWPHEGDWELYLFNPHEREEIALFRLKRNGTVEPLARYSMYADTTYFLLAGVQRPEVSPQHYDLTAHIDKSDRAKIEGEVTLISDRAGLRLLRFRLDPRLTIDRLTSSSYEIETLHAQHSLTGDRVLLVDPPVAFGESLRIEFSFSGQLRNTERRFDAGSIWYPVFGYGERATFAVTVVAPSSRTIVPAGMIQSGITVRSSASSANEKPGSMKTSAVSFTTDLPVPFVSFGLDDFKSYVGRSAEAPPESVLVSLKETLHPASVDPSFAVNPDEGANDLAEIWHFFQQRLGKLPWSSLRVHDLFGWHGRSYPGLVQIGWHTFYPSDPPGYNSQFRAHEVAHQWFGVAVGFDSYHDEWLSEGMAEYLGLCYVQHRHGDQIFRGWLEDYRRSLLTIRDNERKSGEAPGALALGYRTATADRLKDYDLVVYQKGAWVVHMLRALLTNPTTGDDRQFWQMLREFSDRYRGRKATTRDLQFLAEKYSGADLSWFFRQWLYGNSIPRYSVNWHNSIDSSAEAGERMNLLDLDITQRDVEADFQSWLPIRVEYADKSTVDYRLFISGTNQRYQLPATKSKAVRVRLDPGLTLLARF